MFFFEGGGIIFTEIRFSINWLNCDIFAGFMFNKTKTNHFELPISCIFFMICLKEIKMDYPPILADFGQYSNEASANKDRDNRNARLFQSGQ